MGDFIHSWQSSLHQGSPPFLPLSPTKNTLTKYSLCLIQLSDGPNGAKSCGFSGPTSACFPNTTCLAATFDKNLARSVGEALGEEAHSKGIKCLLAPTICIHRHPLGGRNFESFGEDVGEFCSWSYQTSC